MDKGALLDRMGAEGEDRMLLSHVLDQAVRTESRNIPSYTAFLSPREQAMTADLLRLAGTPETSYCFAGGYAGAERCVALFLPDWLDPRNAEIPVRCVRAAYRREERITHRDLLGSLMGLGIVREKVGDILAGEESADVLVMESVADYLLQNWEWAGRTKLHVTEADPANIHIPAQKYEEIRDTVSSLRLDAVLSGGLRIARGKASALVEAGRVEVNWRECVKPDRLLSEGDTVTARGFGKLQLASVGGLTRKGRISIVIRRWV